jgi:alanine dehydrogenase
VRIGVPKEIKQDENRVALTPAGALALTRGGHHVVVESGAGIGSGFLDEDYIQAGATIDPSTVSVWNQANMIVKVKEPIASEYGFFREDLLLFTYLHLAPELALTQALQSSGITAIAYETVQAADGSLPLLTPMSEIAGRMASQIGAQFLEKPYGGSGILLSGAPGVLPGQVLVVGGGVVGLNAARIALGLGAEVTIVEVNPNRLRFLDDVFHGRIHTLMSHEYNLAEAVQSTDLLIGAVLIPGARAPHLVSQDMVKSMRPGSVIVDVAIDQGGSIATIDRITTHSQPTYERFGIIHYAVANMPGAVARTSTLALTNATLGYVRSLADKGAPQALKQDPTLAKGLNVCQGKITFQAVAEAHHLPYYPVEAVLV